MPRIKTDTLQLAVRIPRPWLARLDALIPKIAQAGVQTTRTDAIRAALAKGIDALEAQFGMGEDPDVYPPDDATAALIRRHRDAWNAPRPRAVRPPKKSRK